MASWATMTPLSWPKKCGIPPVLKRKPRKQDDSNQTQEEPDMLHAQHLVRVQILHSSIMQCLRCICWPWAAGWSKSIIYKLYYWAGIVSFVYFKRPTLYKLFHTLTRKNHSNTQHFFQVLYHFKNRPSTSWLVKPDSSTCCQAMAQVAPIHLHSREELGDGAPGPWLKLYHVEIARYQANGISRNFNQLGCFIFESRKLFHYHPTPPNPDIESNEWRKVSWPQ